MKHHYEFEDWETLHQGTEPNRAYYVPFAPQQQAMRAWREESERLILLNGMWDTRLYSSIEQVPEEFWSRDFVAEGFEKREVPACWQMQGLDQNQYVNVRYPIPFDPPHVPHQNPCMAYRTCFQATDEMLGRRTYLNFEGVDSFFYVWINGMLLGYSQVSHSTSEFEITPYLQRGKNLLAVLVLKWSVGTYLECQDKFRMSGIFRDVYLLSRPCQHIRDFGVRTWGCENYTKAIVQVGVAWSGEPEQFSWELYDPTDHLLQQGTASTEVTIPIASPVFWSAEHPALYRFILRTCDEVICQNVGLRDITVKGRTVLLNGKKLRLRGVNRHDSDPVTGFTISREQALTDLRLMKQHNVNAIRSSHYPNAPWFVQLCEEYGFYYMDEADVESHGVTEIFGGGYDTTYGLIAQMPEFEKPILDRVQRCMIRDKNSPAVIAWSLGNESGHGPAFEKAGRWGKEYDPTRLMHYEGSWHQTGGHVNDTSMFDIYSRMYNEPAFVQMWLDNPANTKPFLLVEYCHAMGNGPGDLEDYEQVFLQNDGALGGFVWEWCDHAIYTGTTSRGQPQFWYGGDSGEEIHDGNFCVDGLVSPDRKPHNGLKELKNVFRPVRARWDGQQLWLRNTMDYLDLQQTVCIQWELALDGVVMETGVLETPACPARGETAVPLPVQMPQQPGRADLRLIYTAAKERGFIKRGDTLGFEQLTLRNTQKISLPAKQSGSLTLREEEETITVQGDGFCYCFNRFTGCLEQIERKGRKLLSRPMGFNIWRAPTDNDRKIRRVWEQAGYDRSQIRVSGWKAEQGDTIQIQCQVVFAAAVLQPFLRCKVCWEIDAAGALFLSIEGHRNTRFPFLPRFGIRLFLPRGFEQLAYTGYGPLESYVDKRQASWYGHFESTVKEQYVDYIKPQEHGSHTGCTQLEIKKDGQKIRVLADRPFSFRASHYTQEELTQKQHNYELVPCEDIELCIDYKNSGIGSNSCGPVLPAHYALGEEWFDFRMALLFIEPDGQAN